MSAGPDPTDLDEAEDGPAWTVDHPGRRKAQAEIHARPIFRVEPPVRVRRVALMLGPGGGEAFRRARERLREECRTSGRTPPERSARRITLGTERGAVFWELHNEFQTVTWASGAGDDEPWPAGLDLGGEACGRIVAVRVDVMPDATITPAALAGFDEISLCYAIIEGGRAELATDFLLDRRGFARYELAAGGLGPVLLGTIVRRILEIETYRVLALFGLPLAQKASAALGPIEAALSGAMQRINGTLALSDNRAVLGELHDLQVAAAQTVEDTRFRFAATQAYGGILRKRLLHLDERPKGEFRTLARFLDHRLEPALATCEAVEKRQGALFEQIGRATALLDTRIGLEIEEQNRSILETIARTAQSQYRLQETVEGLSTIAISYYLLGVVGYALHLLDLHYEAEKAVLLSLLAPVIVAGVWLRMRRLRRQHAADRPEG